MSRRELVRTGERIEVRLRFRGTPEELECVDNAYEFLAKAGYAFSVCRLEDGIDWYLEDEEEVARQPAALFVGRWSKSENYYSCLRRGKHAVGMRGMVIGGPDLLPVTPNYPGLLGRWRAMIRGRLLQLLRRRAHKPESIGQRILLWVRGRIHG